MATVLGKNARGGIDKLSNKEARGERNVGSTGVGGAEKIQTPTLTQASAQWGINNGGSTAPQTMDATDIGTAGVQQPIPKLTDSVASQLSNIETQALSIQDTLAERAAQEQATSTGQQPLEGGGTSTGGKLDTIISQYMDMLGTGFQLSDEARTLQEESAAANKRAKDLATQIEQYGKETKDQLYVMSKNQTGMLAGALAADMKNYEYERYARPGGAADMAIEAQFALNNAEYAYQLANDAVTAEKEQYNTQLQGLTNLYTMMQNDMTESESMQYQSQLRLYENRVNSLMESKEIAMQRASQSGAPAEVLSAIRSAQSAEGVWVAAGKYGEDPQLDMQRQQLAISRGNLALAYDKFEWDKWHADRMLQIEAGVQAGEIAAEDAEKVKAATAMLSSNAKLLNAVGEALNNKIGMNAATGRYKSGVLDYLTLGLGGAGAGFAAGPIGSAIGIGSGVALANKRINERENFENDIKLITAAQTLEQFSQLGFSLAPVTEKEVDLVGTSANEVLSSVRIAEDGSMEIKGSTEEFEKNLRAFQEQTQRAFEALLDDPYLQKGVLGNDLQTIADEYYAATGITPPVANTIPMSNSTYYKFSESMTNVPVSY